MPTKKKDGSQKAGTIKITGQTIAELTLNYEGRVLTPLHFGVAPKTQPKKEKIFSQAEGKKTTKSG